MYKIAVTRALSDFGMKYLGEVAQITNLNTMDEEKILEACEEEHFDAVIFRGGVRNPGFFSRFKAAGGKVIGRHGTGMDGFPLDAATECGIPVVFAPGANARSVAEYTIAAIMALYKKVREAAEEVHENLPRQPYMQHQWMDKKIFIIGCGNIGREVAKMSRGLGMEVYGYDAYTPRQVIEAIGAHYCESIDEGLKDADVVTIHTPLTKETENMVNSEFLDKMKPTAFFINTARAGIMDELEVIRRVNDGRLGGAAFDSCSAESPHTNQELIDCKQIIATRHIAAQTVEALDAMAKDCVDGCVAVLNNQRFAKTANPEVYDKLGW